MSFRLLRLRFALIVTCALAGSLAAADDAALQALFTAANQKLDARDYAGAIEGYNTILESIPKADNVWAARGLAKMYLKDLSGARADFAQAISLNPKHVDAYRWRGSLRFNQKDYAGSVADFTQAIAAQPDDALLLGARAEANRALGENDRALTDLNHSLEIEPDSVACLYLRGQIHEEQGDISAALADYSRVIRLKPDHADALNQRGWIKFHRQDWAAAIEDANRVRELAPQAAVAIRLLGYAQFGQGDYAAAATSLAQAADADGENAGYPLFVRHFALLRTGGGDKRLATSWGNWKDQPWLQALGRFIVGQLTEDDLEKAAQETKDGQDATGQICEMHFYIGLARLQAGDKSTARLRFQSALATNQKTYVEDALAAAELQRAAK